MITSRDDITQYLHDILPVANNIEAFFPLPKKIKMYFLGRVVLAYVTVTYIAANKCATYEVNIIFKSIEGKDCIGDVRYDLAGTDGLHG